MGRKPGWIGRLLHRAHLVLPLFLSVFLCIWTISALLPLSNHLSACSPTGSDQESHCSPNIQRLPTRSTHSPGGRRVASEGVASAAVKSEGSDYPPAKFLLRSVLEPISSICKEGQCSSPNHISSSERAQSALRDPTTSSSSAAAAAAAGAQDPSAARGAQKSRHDPSAAGGGKLSFTHNSSAAAGGTQNPSGDKLAEELIAELEVIKQMDSLRASATLSNSSSLLESGVGFTGTPSPACESRRIFIYDLPPKFNTHLLKNCDRIVPWLSMCDFFSNSGLGKLIEDSAQDQAHDGTVSTLLPSGCWYQTHQYSLEIVFHERMKQYPCLVDDPQEADLFYIPYYGGLDVLRWHFVNNASMAQKDQLGMDLVRWLAAQPAWQRNKGVDHVLVLGKISWDFRRHERGIWGNTLLLQPEMQVMNKLLIERQPWHGNDVGVPHPTFFHPGNERDIREWQGHINGAERTHFLSFAGKARPNQSESIRSHLIEQCVGSPASCYYLICEEQRCLEPNSTMDLFIHSEFCLQPPGDSPTRRSIFDSLIGGCIPVLFDPYSAYYQYPWHLPANLKTYSVYIPADDVRRGKVNVIKELQKITNSVRQEMRNRIIYEIMPGLVYAKPGAKLREVEDAFLISLRSLFARVESRLKSQTN